ncbi:hypothetical protein GCM10012275_20320 [Longimycelium tulufanense]|uniref:Major facilitator superfamily (MFS) profile domain-containing protein n=1 Tax=Longimycelium tulufanense TaxID=907463 RepID=A0A8J3CCM7_9PSEU|nr:MFS transporter [Longimycelium tulufanense]GGM49363.1 hypothetical protein GCM10012275_20320 [Longimycelium tulufanense]
MYGREVLGGSGCVGLLFGGGGAGAVLGSIGYGCLGHRMSRWAVYTVCFFIFFIGGAPRTAVFLLGPGLWWLALAMFVAGMFGGTLNPLSGVVVLDRVPEEFRSRVMGMLNAGALSATPLGALGADVAVATWGLPGGFVSAGVVYLLVTLCPLVFPDWRTLDTTVVRPRANVPVTSAH